MSTVSPKCMYYICVQISLFESTFWTFLKFVQIIYKLCSYFNDFGSVVNNLGFFYSQVQRNKEII